MNIIEYKVDLAKLKEHVPAEDYKEFKFKDMGYLTLLSRKQGSPSYYWHGYITPSMLQQLLGIKQYSKFCQGKREFTIHKKIKL